MKLNLVEIYFWFKEDGYVVLSDWLNMNCDGDTKLKFINYYDLQKFYACCRCVGSLGNYVSFNEVKKDKNYCNMIIQQIEGLFVMYSSDDYFVDFKNKDVRNCISIKNHWNILNILQDYMRYSIRHKLIEISESSL